VIGSIESILKRVKAEVVSLRKWDERRLAYDVDKISRGTYILVYFKCDGEKIQEIEKTVRLSEQIMRVLILNAEHMTQEDIDKDTPATKAEKVQEEREAAVEAKVAEAKAAEKAPAKASEDAPAAVEEKAAEEAAEPVEKKADAEAEQPAEATASSEDPVAEASTEASKDESKAAE
jgi:small subunit ribosomal protein S6